MKTSLQPHSKISSILPSPALPERSQAGITPHALHLACFVACFFFCFIKVLLDTSVHSTGKREKEEKKHFCKHSIYINYNTCTNHHILGRHLFMWECAAICI